MKTIPSFLGIAVALALTAQGCFFVADDDGPRIGTLTAEWSIDGYIEPSDCDFYRVDLFELVVYDGADRYYAEATAPCDAFNVSIDLPDGIYSADATLIDYSDRPATITLVIDQLDVRGGTELIVPIDFRPSSFL